MTTVVRRSGTNVSTIAIGTQMLQTVCSARIVCVSSTLIPSAGRYESPCR